MIPEQFEYGKYHQFYLDGINALKVDEHIDRAKLPQGLYAYDLCVADDDKPDFHGVIVPRAGTLIRHCSILTMQPLELDKNGQYGIEDWNLSDPMFFIEWLLKEKNNPTGEELDLLWNKLGEVSFDFESEGDGNLTEPFYLWGPGTDQMEIWDWFDGKYSGGLGKRRFKQP